MADDYSWVDSPLEKKTTKRAAKAKTRSVEATQQLRRRYNQYARERARKGFTAISWEKWSQIHGD